MSTNQEHAAVKLVWYASYGSNLKRKRFMCYIKGGTPEGSAKRNEGAEIKVSIPNPDRYRSILNSILLADPKRGETAPLHLFVEREGIR